MKIFKHIIWSIVLVSLLSACDEDFDKITYDPLKSKAAELSAIDSEIVLEAVNIENIAAVFTWLQAEISYSAAVNYELQVDVKGQNFVNYVAIASIAINNELDEMEYKPKTGDLNSKLLELLEKYEALDGAEPVDFSFRIVAVIAPNHKLFSNVIDSKITVYLGNVPSIYMIGAAVGGWDTAKAVEVVWAGTPNVFSTKAYFDAETDANFRFFNSPSWSASLGGYNVFPNYPAAYLGETGDGDSNFKFIGATGWYEITVNVATGTIQMTPVNEPLIYLTGDATHGWNWNDPVTSLKWVGHQIWQGEVTFIKNNYFRLFEQKDWGPIGYGYNVITSYNSDYLIIAEGHGDPNWQFVGDSGVYLVRIDKRQGSIVLTPVVD